MNIEEINPPQVELWSKIVADTSAESMLMAAMRQVARSLTEMTGRPIELNGLDIETIPVNRLRTLAGDPKAETVGIYLLLTDEKLSGEAILLMQPEDALCLVDWLLEARPGTTTRLGDLERSALSEFGNQTLSSFLNVLADLSGIPLRLSPPNVVVDMLAVILEAVAMAAAVMADELLIIKTDFVNNECSLKAKFWVVPDFITTASVSAATNQWKWNVLERGTGPQLPRENYYGQQLTNRVY